MPELTQAIKGRRSVRKFEERDVPQQHIDRILDAVRWAPSWANTQCWEIVVVRDAELKSALRDTMAKGNPATKAVEVAPVVLAVCGKLQTSGYYKGEVVTKYGDWFLFDLGLATQNICLAAHDLGLASVIVGLFDHDKAAEVLGVPKGYELPVLIPIGYPDQEPKVPERREIEQFTHYDKF
jgi:nitroreductase